MEPPEEHVVYEWTPLEEVAFEVRFPSRIRILKNIEEFQEKIRGLFPIAEEGQAEGQSLSPWQFSTEDGNRRVRIYQDAFSVVSNDHQSFEDLAPLIEDLVGDFTELYEIEQVTRTGLRYINNYRVGTDGEDFFQYFEPPFRDDLYDLERTSSFVFEGRFEDEGRNLTVRSALVEPQGETEEGLVHVLDFDSFSLEKVEPGGVMELTRELHEIIYEAFHRHITEEFANLLEEGPEDVR